jgi:hypothetical protein
MLHDNYLSLYFQIFILQLYLKIPATTRGVSPSWMTERKTENTNDDSQRTKATQPISYHKFKYLFRECDN